MAQSSRSLVICIAIAAATWIVFGQTVRSEFVNFDDDVYVYENGMVRQGLTKDGVAQAFTHAQALNWHPLTTISHMLDCQFFGIKPAGHHFTNVLLHCMTAVLLFLALREMTGALWPSAFVAMVFAIHPLRAESVAWVSERKDVLSGLFFVLTLWAYARYARELKVRSSKSKVFYALTLLFFALGLMSKPMLVSVPLVLLLLDYWPLKRFGFEEVPVESKEKKGRPSPALSSKREEETAAVARGGKLPSLIIEKIPMFVMAAAVCVVVYLVQEKARQAGANISFPMRLGNAAMSYTVYPGQLFYPANLAAFYPYPSDGYPAFQIAVAVLLLVGISAAAVYWRRKYRFLAAGWWWYVVMLLPVIGIVQVGAQARADRYTYLPEIGLCLALAWGAREWAAKWPNRQWALGTGAAVVIAACLVTARAQAAYWHDSETLWKHTLACTTNNAVANENLANEYVRQAHYDQAVEFASRAIEIDPKYADAENCLGYALFQTGQVPAAITHFKQSLKINPEFASAHCNLGMAYLQGGQTEQAIPELEEAIRFQPGMADAHNNLGAALVRKGEPEKAAEHYEIAVGLNPDSLGVNNNYAWLLASCPKDAVRNGAKAVQLAGRANELANSQNLIVWRTLAAAYAESGQFARALEAAGKALDLATAQNNATWINAIRAEMDLYRSGKPFRADGSTP